MQSWEESKGWGVTVVVAAAELEVELGGVGMRVVVAAAESGSLPLSVDLAAE